MGHANKPLSTEIVKEIIKLYSENPTITAKEVADMLLISKPVVLKYLTKHNIPRRESKKRRNYVINESFFDDIEEWGEKQSYLMGFILGDGYNNIKKGLVKITLGIRDEKFLKQLNGLLQTKKTRRDKRAGSSEHSFATMIIFSKYVSNQLFKLGIRPNKTVECYLPCFLKEENMQHFLRGLFDADGCFYVNQKKYLRVSLSANEFLCRDVLNYLTKHNIIKSGGIYKDNRSEIVYSLGIAKKQCVKNLRDYLYRDATIFLSRKKDIGDNFYS